MAAASMSTDFAYAPTNDQTVAVFTGIILFHGLLNTLNTAWLSRITAVVPLYIPRLTVVLRIFQHWHHTGIDHCSLRFPKGQE